MYTRLYFFSLQDCLSKTDFYDKRTTFKLIRCYVVYIISQTVARLKN